MRSIADFTYRRAGLVALAALAVVLVAAPLGAGVFEDLEPFDISDPASEVQLAYAAYEGATGERPEAEVLLLVETPDGASSATGEASIEAGAERLAAVQGVSSVGTPESDSIALADDGGAAIVPGFLEAGAGRVQVGERVEEAFADDPAVLVGGIAVAATQLNDQTEEDTRRIELYAAPLLLLLLLAVFRSPVAAALPLVLAASSIVVTFALLSSLANFIDLDLFSLQVVTGLGVGLAIDYSLFVLARYRIEIRRGEGYQLAQQRTMVTAGRTVAFGALTVAAALAALILFPQQFLSSTGIAGGIVALLSGATAILVLPALLALLGPRIDPGFESTPARAPIPPDPLSGGSRFWTRLSKRVMSRPLPVATISVALMLAVASPAVGGELTSPDGRVLPQEESAKRVFDAVNERFSELPAGQLSIVIPPGASEESIEPIAARLESRPGIDAVTPSRTLADGSTYLAALSAVDPLSARGQRQVRRVRNAGWPEGTLIGGRAAELADQRSSISENAPAVVALVVAGNLLLVLVMLRSLVLPLVSIVLNALTVLASYGIMVALFENETSAELLGTVAQPGIDVSVPILAFAVVFGLSTDYGIFLFSRIAEARRSGLDEAEAITAGLAGTGRLITSAAVIFSVAVGANVFSDLVIVKEFAVAVSIAVLLDATIVRGVAVPAILKLLGGRAWYWPGGRRRLATARPRTATGSGR